MVMRSATARRAEATISCAVPSSIHCVPMSGPKLEGEVTPDALRRIQICSRATAEGTIEIYLKDNGPGLETTDRKRVFVPFYTTKDHGLGLGLSICSTIIEKHGGSIDLRNDASGGAVAEISLPAESMPLAAQWPGLLDASQSKVEIH